MKLITGNTYPVKEKLKAMGGRWNADERGWEVPDDKAAEAQAIVAGAPAKSSSSASRSSANRPRYSKCQVCGVQASRYLKIYGSGECRDCYEERKAGY